MTEFLLMGGYAFYVWGSFAITAVVMVIHLVMNRIQHKKILSEIFDTQHTNPQQAHE